MADQAARVARTPAKLRRTPAQVVCRSRAVLDDPRRLLCRCNPTDPTSRPRGPACSTSTRASTRRPCGRHDALRGAALEPGPRARVGHGLLQSGAASRLPEGCTRRRVRRARRSARGHGEPRATPRRRSWRRMRSPPAAARCRCRTDRPPGRPRWAVRQRHDAEATYSVTSASMSSNVCGSEPSATRFIAPATRSRNHWCAGLTWVRSCHASTSCSLPMSTGSG